MTAHRKRITAEVLLASVTLFWGATFPIVKEAVTEVPVLSFLGIRFLFSAALLALVAGKSLFTLGAKGYGRGVFLGTLLFLSYLFQTLGLERTTASNAAFLTGLNVIWVPLLSGPLLGKRPSTGAKIGVAAAVAGLLLLTWQWPWRIEPGDALVIVCSIFVALHILGLDSLTEGHDGRALAFVQIATMAALALGASLVVDDVTWPRTFSPSLIEALVITSVFATVYAFWVQTTFQRRTTPTRAALIYTLEPVFGALFAYLLMDERMTPLGWVGAILILAGTVVSELWAGRKVICPGPDGGLSK